MTNAHCQHIGIQVWTTDTLHTLAYQVIPTVLNHRQLDPNEFPLDYWVSHHDLYIGDILFDPHSPAIGQPTVDEDEVLHAPPPYPKWYNHSLMEMYCVLFPTHWAQLNINRDERLARPYGLLNGPSARHWVPCPQGTVSRPMAECMQTCAYLNWISDTEVNQVLSHALYPEIWIGDMHDEPIGSGPYWGNLDTVNCTETRTNPSTRLQQMHQNANNPQPTWCQLSGVWSLDPPRQAAAHVVETRSMVEHLPRCLLRGNQPWVHRPACSSACCRSQGPWTSWETWWESHPPPCLQGRGTVFGFRRKWFLFSGFGLTRLFYSFPRQRDSFWGTTKIWSLLSSFPTHWCTWWHGETTQ